MPRTDILPSSYANTEMHARLICATGAAGSMKASFWLALEDAASFGFRIPDMVFVYNAADT